MSSPADLDFFKGVWLTGAMLSFRICFVIVAFMACLQEIGDADSFRAPALISGFHVSMTVQSINIMLKAQSFVLYIYASTLHNESSMPNCSVKILSLCKLFIATNAPVSRVTAITNG